MFHDVRWTKPNKIGEGDAPAPNIELQCDVFDANLLKVRPKAGNRGGAA